MLRLARETMFMLALLHRITQGAAQQMRIEHAGAAQTIDGTGGQAGIIDVNIDIIRDQYDRSDATMIDRRLQQLTDVIVPTRPSAYTTSSPTTAIRSLTSCARLP